MSERFSQPFFLKVFGPYACFSRPEMKVERVSYDVMTPSAARGVLEAIYWKPEFRWQVVRIDVLSPIVWDSVRRNEVDSTASPKTADFFIEDRRQQRAALILRDVAYVIHARIALQTNQSSDEMAKHVDIFRRRASKGQCFHRPYLGTREFAADFELLEAPLQPAPIEDKELGWMLYDLDFTQNPPAPQFFKAELVGGSVAVPPLGSPEVRQ